MRTFAIINIHDDANISSNIISKLGMQDDIVVFQDKSRDFNCGENVKTVIIPNDVVDSQSKIKNYAMKYFFDCGYSGYVHFIEDSIEVLVDPSVFVSEIERMMSVFGMKSWFNTITDVCNYTFKVYNPRFSVQIDEPGLKEKYDKKIMWTSHANTGWICYDYSIATYDEIKFDDQFKIPMYYIIKFLAERRNNKKPGELYYMNFYPTIPEEIGVFRGVNVKDTFKNTDDDFGRERIIFDGQGIRHDPDLSIDAVMEDIVRKLEG